MNLSRFLLRLLLGRRLPRTRGTLSIPGLRADLRIHRDRWGIPYIEASDEQDAYFGIGFCHGQDRAFQLDSCSAPPAAPSPNWSAATPCPSIGCRGASAFTGPPASNGRSSIPTCKP